MRFLRILFAPLDLTIECVRGLLRQNESALAAWIRRRLHGGNCSIDTQVVIKNQHGFKAGPRSALYHGTYILNSHGQLELGPDSHLGAYCYVNACYGRVVIGSHVAIGPGTKIFSYSNHYRAAAFVTDEKLTEDVTIGSNVFIGANCVILPGTRIADNVVIGAGSIVRKELLPNSVYAGVPCRLVRMGWYDAVAESTAAVK